MIKLEETSSIKYRIPQSQEVQDSLKVIIVVWNLQGTLPPHNSIKELMDKATGEADQTAPDLLCIATQ
jgi:hypothetical protein